MKTKLIDHKIEPAHTKIEQYEKLKQSLIYETVTHGLDKSLSVEDTGVEWIGKIPSHWKVKRVKDLLISAEGGLLHKRN